MVTDYLRIALNITCSDLLRTNISQTHQPKMSGDGIKNGGTGSIRETGKLDKSDQRGPATSRCAGQPGGRKFLDRILMIINAKFWSSSCPHKVKEEVRGGWWE